MKLDNKKTILVGFAFFLISSFIFLKLLMVSNLEKFFKQGKIFEIRIMMIFLSFILAFLFSSSITKLIETLYNIIMK